MHISTVAQKLHKHMHTYVGLIHACTYKILIHKQAHTYAHIQHTHTQFLVLHSCMQVSAKATTTIHRTHKKIVRPYNANISSTCHSLSRIVNQRFIFQYTLFFLRTKLNAQDEDCNRNIAWL